eukprot:5084523-Amphidinium_carterae.1
MSACAFIAVTPHSLLACGCMAGLFAPKATKLQGRSRQATIQKLVGQVMQKPADGTNVYYCDEQAPVLQDVST